MRLLILLCGVAQAFTILTPVSEACHEDITLEALEAVPELMAALVARATELGVPGDERTQAFIKSLSNTYDLEGDPATRYVLASLIAGARNPDTKGFALVSFNETRHTHIEGDAQAAHTLRRAGHNGVEGQRAAIEEARGEIEGRLAKARAEWKEESEANPRTRWTFPFYGEQDVRVFGPAFRVGELAHTMQDSFTHALRDDEFRIVDVLNFVDPVQGSHSIPRDGLAHSDRLDECDDSKTLDRRRMDQAREASRELMAAMADELDTERSEGEVFGPILDARMILREGCDAENDFCESPWLEHAREGATEPIRLWFCTTTPGSTPEAPWALLLLLAATRRLLGASRPT